MIANTFHYMEAADYKYIINTLYGQEFDSLTNSDIKTILSLYNKYIDNPTPDLVKLGFICDTIEMIGGFNNLSKYIKFDTLGLNENDVNFILYAYGISRVINDRKDTDLLSVIVSFLSYADPTITNVKLEVESIIEHILSTVQSIIDNNTSINSFIKLIICRSTLNMLSRNVVENYVTKYRTIIDYIVAADNIDIENASRIINEMVSKSSISE